MMTTMLVMVMMEILMDGGEEGDGDDGVDDGDGDALPATVCNAAFCIASSAEMRSASKLSMPARFGAAGGFGPLEGIEGFSLCCWAIGFCGGCCSVAVGLCVGSGFGAKDLGLLLASANCPTVSMASINCKISAGVSSSQFGRCAGAGGSAISGPTYSMRTSVMVAAS